MRCRAVRAALAIDKARALELFRQITVGPFPPLSCDDALAPSLSEYYETLREVALNAYAPEDRKEGRHIELIEAAARNIATPRQLEPVARLLATFPMPVDRKAELAGAYAAALKNLSADPRSFGAVTFGFGQAIVDLSKGLRAGGISTVPLVDAFHTYLSRHLQGTLCAETADAEEGGVYMRQMVETFLNDELLAPSGATEIAPLKFDALKPKSVAGRAKFSDYWQSGRSREIMAQYKALRFGTKEQQEEYNKRERRKDGMAHFLPEELRRTPEWEAQARAFLDELDRWSKNHDEPETDFFHQICLQYAGLLAIIPPGHASRDRAPDLHFFPEDVTHGARESARVADPCEEAVHDHRCHARAPGAHANRSAQERKPHDESLRRPRCTGCKAGARQPQPSRPLSTFDF